MKVTVELSVWSDDFNSDPPPVKVEIEDGYVTMKLSDTDRELSFARNEFDAFVAMYLASKGKGRFNA